MKEIHEANSLLEENITSISNVNEWAEIMGYEKTSKFSYDYRRFYGLRPAEAFVEIRIKNIIEYFTKNPSEKYYSICLEFGFVNEQSLYKFFKRHTKLSPIEYRKEIQKRDTDKEIQIKRYR
ncbi:hypothetical protein A8B79_00225 [Balneola sp. EhC07]|uniref:helix-turn-helix domain-containing protein n=1 Tax=Balneola sp. EhC07 TaxID=1849360 RepID=UPI0007F3F56B|nr:helix-turn-helix domain-containing protein [Balneola sp. EhC07]OAN64607.1 hypothetical protein A8B79_00225 [Balneola sp. EhC07]